MLTDYHLCSRGGGAPGAVNRNPTGSHLDQHMITVSVAAEEGKPAELVQPNAVVLAKIIVSKLR